MLKKLAAEKGAIFIPVVGKITNPDMKNDFFISNWGYKIVVGRIYNAIKRYINTMRRISLKQMKTNQKELFAIFPPDPL